VVTSIDPPGRFGVLWSYYQFRPIRALSVKQQVRFLQISKYSLLLYKMFLLNMHENLSVISAAQWSMQLSLHIATGGHYRRIYVRN
jgi:hypothetical protein